VVSLAGCQSIPPVVLCGCETVGKDHRLRVFEDIEIKIYVDNKYATR
jgi:hypothetical protein